MSITGSKILETNFCGFKLANPFLVASGPSSRDLNMIKRAFESGWAGVVTKTISLTPTRDVSPRLHILNYGHSTINIELISSVSPRVWIKWIKELKKNYPRRMLIASIMGSDRAVTWKKLGQLMAEAGADALELNISCPHGLPEKGMGSLVGQDPDRAAEVTDWVKRAVKIPVIVKLTPNVTDIGLIARACARAGADAISGINTVKSLGGIDLKRLEPLPSVDGYSTFGGYGGAGVKPIALRCLAEIGQAVPLPLSGMGGILTWQDAAEFILIGCGTVQVCSGVMLFGYQLINDLANGLEQYLLRRKVKSVKKIVGLVKSKIVKFSQLNAKQKKYAVVNTVRCLTECRLCVMTCQDAGFQAITSVRGQTNISKKKCDGCGLCLAICPADAITLV